MTEDKALKRAIRRRMSKTGESYTAARRHIAKEGAPEPEPVDYGQSDAAIKRGTGKGWEEWLKILDAWGAKAHSHTEIARYLNEEHGVPGWWSQSVTVGYERARGMRAAYQRPHGYSVGVSKTYPVSAQKLFDAVADPRRRNRWLESGTLKVRTTHRAKSARFDFTEDGSRVVVGFTPKGDAKATIHVEHERLSHPDDVETMRLFWKRRLGRLAEYLRA